jgi:FAD/FMN-containing dehydrogenase
MINRRRFMQGALAGAAATALPTSRALAAAYHALTRIAGDLAAVTGAGGAVELPQADLQALSDSLRGRLLLPGNDGYDEARRVMNGSIDKHPALIAQCVGAADVSHAVGFAREYGLLVAVKCGGHSFAGKSTCDGGLQIDLSPLQGVRVDPVARVARVAGGSLLGPMDAETMGFGLVTTAGTVSHTGVGGLTLGGGFGRVGRRFGLALDNVLAVDIITADGEFRRASPDENPDLYWAVRGGGGNFGVVTSFEFQLHPMDRQVIGGDIVFPISQARQILDFYADYSMAAPDDLYLDFYMAKDPGDEPGIVGLHACYSGPKSRAEEVLGPIRKAGQPLDDGIQAVDYVAIQKSWDWTDPRTVGSYLKSGFVTGIDPEVVDRLLDGFDPDPSRRTSIFFQQSGGAIGRVPSNATAFAHRDATHNMFCTVSWDPSQDRTPHVDYIKRWWATLEPSTNGWYTNEISNESFAKVRANYQGNFDRLVQVKGRYDPTNLFRLNANVPPSV